VNKPFNSLDTFFSLIFCVTFPLAFLPLLPNERTPQEALKGEKLSKTGKAKKNS